MTSFPSTILSLFFGHTSKDSKEDRRGKDWGGRDAREVSGEQDLGNADNIPDNVSEEISSSRSPSPETSSGPDAELHQGLLSFSER